MIIVWEFIRLIEDRKEAGLSTEGERERDRIDEQLPVARNLTLKVLKSEELMGALLPMRE